jgi:hypothetical protein
MTRARSSKPWRTQARLFTRDDAAPERIAAVCGEEPVHHQNVATVTVAPVQNDPLMLLLPTRNM